jgi:hypothetical protein
MVVLVPKVHDTEDLGGLGVLYHHHVAICVVGLDAHTEVVAWLVFVSHLQYRLHRGLLLPSPVTTQLQRVVGVVNLRRMAEALSMIFSELLAEVEDERGGTAASGYRVEPFKGVPWGEELLRVAEAVETSGN